MARTYYVYNLASRSRTLYTGVTNNLDRRLMEHRQKLVPGFTTRYHIFRLVHFERFGDIRRAIAREKEIKGWRREKKVWLIQRDNPLWDNLAQPQNQIQPQKQILHRRSPNTGDRVQDDNAKEKDTNGGLTPAATLDRDTR